MSSEPANIAKSSLWGIARGLCVHALIYPLEVLKIRQQALEGKEKISRIASDLLKQEGIGAFYKGLSRQLGKNTLKQFWRWPMMTEIPRYLEPYQLKDTTKQTLTGLSIATVDAAVTTPLEKSKILSAFSGKTAPLVPSHKILGGWHGFSVHWAKLASNWASFLTAQKYFRDREEVQPEQPLTLPQVGKVGIETALAVSVATAPFDAANTLKQARNISLAQLFSRKEISKLSRGWPLNALSLTIHNIASVFVLDRLSKS